jgi:hypothetical protein
MKETERAEGKVAFEDNIRHEESSGHNFPCIIFVYVDHSLCVLPFGMPIALCQVTLFGSIEMVKPYIYTETEQAETRGLHYMITIP